MADYSHINSLQLKKVRPPLNKPIRPKHSAYTHKKCFLQIKLFANENINLTGCVTNITCCFSRVDITFKAINKACIIEKILFNPNIILQKIEFGNGIALTMKAPLNIIWNKCLCVNENEIYEIGFALYLNEAQRRMWDGFYNCI